MADTGLDDLGDLLARSPRARRYVRKALAKAHAKGKAAGTREAEARLDGMLTRFRVLKELNGSGALFAEAWRDGRPQPQPVLKARDPDDTDEVELPEPDVVVDAPHPDGDALALAMLEVVVPALELGEDPTEALDRLREKFDPVRKAWSEESHPRDDHGRFVSAGEIRHASRDPKKLEELRAAVTDPGERKKLDAAVAGAVVPGAKAGLVNTGGAIPISHLEEGHEHTDVLRGGLVAAVKAGDPDAVKAWQRRAEKTAAVHWREARAKALKQFDADYPQAAGQEYTDWQNQFAGVAGAFDDAEQSVREAYRYWAGRAEEQIAAGTTDPDDFDAGQEEVRKAYEEAQNSVWDAVQEARDRLGGKEKGFKLGRYFKAWDSSKHPRDKSGRFIAKDDLKAAQTDPKKAAELRAKVKPEDAHKLEAVISGEEDPGRTRRGQAKHEAGRRREAKASDRAKADELISKLSDYHAKPGSVDLTADDLHALADHLPRMRVEDLRRARMALRASFKGNRKKEGMVEALVAHARGMALDARSAELGFDPEEMRQAAGLDAGAGAAESTPPEESPGRYPPLDRRSDGAAMLPSPHSPAVAAVPDADKAALVRALAAESEGHLDGYQPHLAHLRRRLGWDESRFAHAFTAALMDRLVRGARDEGGPNSPRAAGEVAEHLHTDPRPGDREHYGVAAPTAAGVAFAARFPEEPPEEPARPSPGDRIDRELTDADRRDLEAGPRPGPGDREPFVDTSAHAQEREEAAQDRADRMAQWAAAKPQSVQAQEMADAAGKRAGRTRQAVPGATPGGKAAPSATLPKVPEESGKQSAPPETGKPYTALLHRGTGLAADEAKKNRTPSQFGVGEYWSPHPEVAATYGPDVASETVRLANPYVLHLDKKVPYFTHLRREFGTHDPEEITRILRGRGHDGIVVTGVPVNRFRIGDGEPVAMSDSTEVVRFPADAGRLPGGRAGAAPPAPKQPPPEPSAPVQKVPEESGTIPPTPVDKPTPVGNTTRVQPPASGGDNAGGGKMTRDEVHAAVLARSWKTPSGNTVAMKRLGDGNLGFEVRDAAGKQIREGWMMEPSELSPSNGFHKQMIAALKKRGENPADYREVGGVIVPADVASHMGAALREYRGADAADLAANVPGLDELRAALAAADRYQTDFGRMMEDEFNDGVRPPAPPAGPSVGELGAKYPRAALYIEAEEHANASHDRKVAAGNRAKKMLAEGAPEAEVRAVLDNWLPESAYWN